MIVIGCDLRRKRTYTAARQKQAEEKAKFLHPRNPPACSIACYVPLVPGVVTASPFARCNDETEETPSAVRHLGDGLQQEVGAKRDSLGSEAIANTGIASQLQGLTYCAGTWIWEGVFVVFFASIKTSEILFNQNPEGPEVS